MKKIGIILTFIVLFLTACAPTHSSVTSSQNETSSFFNQSDQATTQISKLFELADNTTSCDKMITQSLSLKEAFTVPGFGIYFSSRSHSGYHISIDQVNEQQKIECLRIKENGDYYAIFHPKEGGRVYSFFLKQDNYLLSHSIYMLKTLDRKQFDQLKIGDPFAKILSIDPAIKKCYDQGFVCNCMDILGKTCTVHMIEDDIVLISYRAKEEGNTDPNQIVIDEIQWFEEGKLFVDAPNYLIHGVYDYSILPQDYIH